MLNLLFGAKYDMISQRSDCMLYVGCHLSASGGNLQMVKTAQSIGANTFAFFTRNPRGGSVKALDEKDIADFLEYSKENGIDVILAHSPYTLNGCSADEKIRNFVSERHTVP